MSAPTDFPTESVTLDPAEYLRFLGLLEDRMPPGTRAYLVTMDDGGRRQLRAVPDTATVLDLKSELVDRLAGMVVPDRDWLASVRDCCNRRLGQQGVDGRSEVERQVAALVGNCALVAHRLCDVAVKLSDEFAVDLTLIELLAAHLGYQADLASKRLGDIRLRGGAEEWLFPWVAAPAATKGGAA